MYYVYRFLNTEGNVIYIGKSKTDLCIRLKGHKHLPNECYSMVYKIEYIECKTEADMSIKEIYYINKYRGNEIFFNLLDKTELPQSVEFQDVWYMYEGKLAKQFCNSINYINKYPLKNTVNSAICHKKEGVSSFMYAFTREEITLIIEYMLDKIENATSYTQEKIHFRNLVMFGVGINIPIKPNELLKLQYKDLFDESDNVKPYKMILNRTYKDDVLEIPLQSNVEKVLKMYTTMYEFSYEKNAEDYLFFSKKKQKLNVPAYSKTIATIARAVGITKNIGGESLRKTYGYNVYQMADNKLEALIFLEYLYGQRKYGQLIKYSGLFHDKLHTEYFLGEKFALFKLDFDKLLRHDMFMHYKKDSINF